MDIGFIGLGKMGFPMARRLIEARHQLVVFDPRKDAVDKLVALGAVGGILAKRGRRPRRDRDGEPAVAAGLARCRDRQGRRDRGQRVKRFVDLSTVGAQMAVRIHDLLTKRNIVQLDCPVCGGVSGAEKGTLAVMVSGPKADSRRSSPRWR